MVAEHHRVSLDRQTGKVRPGDSGTVDALDDSLTNVLVREIGRLSVEGEVAPLQRTSGPHIGIITLLGCLVAVFGDDGVGDVDLFISKSLSLGSVLHRLESDGIKLRLVAPPFVITLDGQSIGGLVHLGGDEGAGEPVRIRLLPARVEGVRVGDALLRQHIAP